MTALTLLGSIIIPPSTRRPLSNAALMRCSPAFVQGLTLSSAGRVMPTALRTSGLSGHPVRVVEVSGASKPTALRAAEEVVSAFPRLYLDAAMILIAASARRVDERLRIGPALAARPPIKYDTKHSSWLIRNYYRARAGLRAVIPSLCRVGVYGLSEAGRQRFGHYPDVVAQDLFVAQPFYRARSR